MKYKGIAIFMIVVMVFIVGCGNRALVNYGQVEDTNYVYTKLVTGKMYEGTVLKSEPHQLVLKLKDGTQKSISKSSIESIKRKPPVTDDYGRGISEDEIKMNQENKNAAIYGIGGGILSFGASFFVGSMIGNSMDDGGSVMLGTTAVGGSLGTLMFVKAGKAKDREEAIIKIQDERRTQSVDIDQKTDTEEEIEKSILEEKKKQEELRIEREKLLKQLDD